MLSKDEYKKIRKEREDKKRIKKWAKKSIRQKFKKTDDFDNFDYERELINRKKKNGQ